MSGADRIWATDRNGIVQATDWRESPWPCYLRSTPTREAAEEMREALQLVRMSRGWQYLSAEAKAVLDAALHKAEGHE